MLRGERMSAGTLVLPVDRARDYMNVIGGKANIEFRDEHYDKLALRPYRKYIQRLDEMERQLRFLIEEIGKSNFQEISNQFSFGRGSLSAGAAVYGEPSYYNTGLDTSSGSVLRNIGRSLGRFFGVRNSGVTVNNVRSLTSSLELRNTQQGTDDLRSINPQLRLEIRELLEMNALYYHMSVDIMANSGGSTGQSGLHTSSSTSTKSGKELIVVSDQSMQEVVVPHLDTYRLEEVEQQIRMYFSDFQQFTRSNKEHFVSQRSVIEEVLVLSAYLGNGLVNENEDTMNRIGNDAEGDETPTSTAEVVNPMHLPLVVQGNPIGMVQGTRIGGAPAIQVGLGGQIRLPTTSDPSGPMVQTVAGVIDTVDRQRFERFLFRSTHGNTFAYFKENRYLEERTVFIIFFQKSALHQYIPGRSQRQRDHKSSIMSHMSHLHDKVLKICRQFGCSVFDVSPYCTTNHAVEKRLVYLSNLLKENARAFEAKAKFIEQDLQRLLEVQQSGNSLIEDYRLFCLKEKGIFGVLNMFSGEGQLLRCDVWYPKRDEDEICRLLISQSAIMNYSPRGTGNIITGVGHYQGHHQHHDVDRGGMNVMQDIPLQNMDQIFENNQQQLNFQPTAMLVSDRLLNKQIELKYHYGSNVYVEANEDIRDIENELIDAGAVLLGGGVVGAPPGGRRGGDHHPGRRGGDHGGDHSDDLGVSPPTYFRSNTLTKPFQDLVFTYGVPRYQEISPVIFTVVTFPFLFGVMFGDVGHGLLLLSFALYLCFGDKQSIFGSFIPYRYMLLLMGFFATYAGFLYNDMFSVGLDLFGSRWKLPKHFEHYYYKDGELHVELHDGDDGDHHVLITRKPSPIVAVGKDSENDIHNNRREVFTKKQILPSLSNQKTMKGKVHRVSKVETLAKIHTDNVLEDQGQSETGEGMIDLDLLVSNQPDEEFHFTDLNMETSPSHVRTNVNGSKERGLNMLQARMNNREEASFNRKDLNHETSFFQHRSLRKKNHKELALSSVVGEQQPASINEKASIIGPQEGDEKKKSKKGSDSNKHYFTMVPDYDITNKSAGKKVSKGENINKHDMGKEDKKAKDLAKDSARYSGPYPFGIDPAWHGAQNELLFVNSLKMKISVLFGVTQMFLGIILRYGNAWRERHRHSSIKIQGGGGPMMNNNGVMMISGNAGNNGKIDIVCECIPMTIFLVCFFGYMDYMILYKWVTPMDSAPSIIQSLIAQVMGGPGTGIFASVETETLLLTLCVLCIPVMLIPKPLILWFKHKKAVKETQFRIENESSLFRMISIPKFDVGEVVIHQIIETIEFILGTISHTASYLRQWALSLAHQQLSSVFFKYTIQAALLQEGSIMFKPVHIFLSFAMWFIITVAVLMCMDSLECFLHTLRLHWVEFQSKFYRADGHLFSPFRHQISIGGGNQI